MIRVWSTCFVTASLFFAPMPHFAKVSLAQVAKAIECDAATAQSLLEPNAASPFFLNCSIKLPKGAVIKRSIIFEGSSASRSTLDCNGGTIDASGGRGRIEKTAIIVRSRQQAGGNWDVPANVTVQNCVIKGFMRVYGLDENANGENMRISSLRPDHTEFAQQSAPKRTSFLNLSLIAPGGAPLYIGPGTTWTTLANSRLTGDTTGTAIYIDAESGRNVIKNNEFSITTRSRELIAIDGSTRNEIIGNNFNDPVNGGIYVYRNCGEGGVIRHQKPDFNTIAGNSFKYAGDGKIAKPAVWLGSRGGKQKFCFTDSKYPYGSSSSPLDFAQKNTVDGNKIIGGSQKLIRDDDKNNIIQNNAAN